MIVWQDGAFIEDGPVRFDPTDRGPLLGDGVFETVKVADGRALFLDGHLCRMCRSAGALDLTIDRGVVEAAVDAVTTKSGRANGALRITLTRGPGPRGLGPIPRTVQRPVLSVILSPAAATHPAPSAKLPPRLVMAPFIRPASAPTSRHKTLSYADNLFARADAERRGGEDAVFLNERGDITCTTMANLFLDTGDGFVTPPLSAGILPGIVREVLIEAARREGRPVTVRPVRPHELDAHAVYRTNSLLGVEQVTGPAGKEIAGSGRLPALYAAAEAREKTA